MYIVEFSFSIYSRKSYKGGRGHGKEIVLQKREQLAALRAANPPVAYQSTHYKHIFYYREKVLNITRYVLLNHIKDRILENMF